MKPFARRNRRGEFSKRGQYIAREGRLIRHDFVGPLPPPTFRTAPGRPTRPQGPPATPRGRDVEPPEPSVSESPTARKGAKYTTWFKALGTMGRREEMKGAESPDLLSEDLEEFAAPAAFYSNQSGLLGRVRWRGVRPLDALFDELNSKLQFAGEESADFDFRLVYSSWEYRYQVIETLGPTDRIITEVNDSYPRRRR